MRPGTKLSERKNEIRFGGGRDRSDRIVGTNGSFTGYAGGIEKKVALLKLEKADMEGFFVPKKGTAL